MGNAEIEIKRIAHLIAEEDLSEYEIDLECVKVAWFLRAENERITPACIKAHAERYLGRTFEGKAA